MGRQPCCEKVGLKRGPWSAEEDMKLVTFITRHGHECWRQVPKLSGISKKQNLKKKPLKTLKLPIPILVPT